LGGIFNIEKTVIPSGKSYLTLSLSSDIVKNSQYFSKREIKSFLFVIYLEICGWFNKSDILMENCSFVIDIMLLFSKFSGAI